jgi:hypothetical protein
MIDRAAITATASRSREPPCMEMLLELETVAVACGVPPVFAVDNRDATRFWKVRVLDTKSLLMVRESDADIDAMTALVLLFDAKELCIRLVPLWLIERVLELLIVADVAWFDMVIAGLIIMAGKPLMVCCAGCSLI